LEEKLSKLSGDLVAKDKLIKEANAEKEKILKESKLRAAEMEARQ